MVNPVFYNFHHQKTITRTEAHSGLRKFSWESARLQSGLASPPQPYRARSTACARSVRTSPPRSGAPSMRSAHSEYAGSRIGPRQQPAARVDRLRHHQSVFPGIDPWLRASRCSIRLRRSACIHQLRSRPDGHHGSPHDRAQGRSRISRGHCGDRKNDACRRRSQLWNSGSTSLTHHSYSRQAAGSVQLIQLTIPIAVSKGQFIRSVAGAFCTWGRRTCVLGAPRGERLRPYPVWLPRGLRDDAAPC